MRVVVLGYIVRGPIGGLAWHHLQYVMGLARLGYDVRFIEDSDDYPGCYDPQRHVTDTDPTYGLRFATDAFASVGLADKWAYYDAHTSRWLGGASNDADEFCRSADVMLNVSAINPLREWTADIPLRILIDTDPVFVQVRHIENPAARRLALAHNSFFTFATNVQTGTAELPDDGFKWRATRQPVVLDAWQATPAVSNAPYTTVMQWRSYPPVEYNGRRYGMKSESFEQIMSLPAHTSIPIEVAMGGIDAVRDRLSANGWLLSDSLRITRTPQTYQKYIRDSRGELAVAKHGYVVSNSGWFSERSSGYLASGRPVVTQETGFSEWCPVGNGLLSFSDEREAIDAITTIESDYARHSAAARKIAEEHFDSRLVLTRLLEEADH